LRYLLAMLPLRGLVQYFFSYYFLKVNFDMFIIEHHHYKSIIGEKKQNIMRAYGQFLTI